MIARDAQLDAARKALRSDKGLTVMNLSRRIKIGYQTAYRLVTLLKAAGEIESAGYAPTGTHQAQIWKLKSQS